MKTEQVWKIGDCLELLPGMPDKSIDMILTDLPYGMTACSWDTIIPFEPLWEQYKRIIKDNGAIVLTASQPFTSMLVMSNIEMFKYEWIFHKSHSTGHLNSRKMPMRQHENILVFCKNQPTYNPQMGYKSKNVRKGMIRGISKQKPKVYGKYDYIDRQTPDDVSYPSSIQYFKKPFCGRNDNCEGGIHPTQKPLALIEYLIKTYTNEGDMVHDSCIGSGTILEACLNTNRNCIGFEISDEWEPHYRKRLKSDNSKLTDTW